MRLARSASLGRVAVIMTQILGRPTRNSMLIPGALPRVVPLFEHNLVGEHGLFSWLRTTHPIESDCGCRR